MSAKPRAEVEVGFNAAEFKKAVGQLESTVKNQVSNIAATFAVFNQIGGYLRSAASQIADYAKKAGEVEVIERRAAAAIGGSLESLKRHNLERQRSLGIDADDQLKLQTKLAQLGVQKSKLDDATKATIGLANATGKDMASAGILVAKAYTGHVEALGRLNIKVKTQAEAEAALQKMYGVTLSEVGSYTRNVAALEAAWGDTEEALGSMVTQSDVINKKLQETTSIITSLNTVLGSKGGQGLGGMIFKVAESQLENSWFGYMWKASTETAKNMEIIARNIEKQQQAVPLSADVQAAIAAVGGGIDKNYKGALPGGIPLANFNGFAPTFDMQDLTKVPKRARRAGPSKPDGGIDFGTPEDDSQAEQSWADMIGFSEVKTEKAVGRIRHSFDKINNAIDIEFKGLQKQAATEAGRMAALTDLAATGIATTASMLGQAFAQIAANSAEGEKAMGQFLGSMISMIGQLCVQLGTAAILAGALGTAVPLFAGLSGPQSIGLGAALVAGGIGIMAVGGALGGSSKGGAPKAPSASPRSGGNGTRLGGFQGDGGDLMPGLGYQQQAPTPLVVNFNAPVGDPRAVARQFQDVLRRGQPPGRGGGW